LTIAARRTTDSNNHYEPDEKTSNRHGKILVLKLDYSEAEDVFVKICAKAYIEIRDWRAQKSPVQDRAFDFLVAGA